MTIDKRLLNIFSTVLSADIASVLTIDSSTDTVPNWNSLTFIEIIVAIEAAFRLQFSTLEAARMHSLKAIYDVLAEKGIELDK